MTRRRRTAKVASLLCLGLAVLFVPRPAFAQVSPAEVSNTKLRSVEQKYLLQLQLLHRAIADAKFPFPLYLTRYVTADPDRQVTFDARGLEFVNFQNDVVLKTSAIYRAAYNSDQLTQNERAAHTFRDVIVPILRLISEQIPADVDCDAVGFEISYHTRAPNKSYEFEGKEILVVVLSRDDAFAFSNIADEEQRQAILNRSPIFVNGKEFGLALDDRNPLDREARTESALRAPTVNPAPPASALPATRSSSDAARSGPVSRAASRIDAAEKPSSSLPGVPAVPAGPVADTKPAATPADAERLQSRYQAQLDSLLKEGIEKFHLVDYAPPAFTIYHDRLVLQLTLRNTLSFDKNTTSIYRRAAQTFDLFLAPELKGLLQNLPAGANFDALDFSVLNRLGNEKTSSEAVEFVCPLKSVRTFANDEVTSQDLINQSIVLINGVRVALNLQLVE